MAQLIEFATHHWELVLALVAVIALLLTGGNLFGGGVKQVGPVEATGLINHQDALVLDTREVNEFSAGHIINALHIPAGRVDKDISRLEKFKDRQIIVACRSGSRSASACRQLKKLGFENVYNLQGGVMAWQSANLPLVRGK